jgi:cytochrome c biogenesis protein CcdA
MIDAPLALAFAAGLVATVNPCGFAMLPAYLSYFVGTGEENETRVVAMQRALYVGGIVSLGFLVVFGLTGVLISAGTAGFQGAITSGIPWVALVVGAAIVILGVAMLRGYELTVRLPKAKRARKGKGTGSVFAFGVSYALASLSCTLPVFLSVVALQVQRTDFVSGVATFIAYGLGMSMLLVGVTIAIGLGQHSLVGWLRRSVRYINRVSGFVLILAGSYIVWFWGTTLASGAGALNSSGPFRFIENLSQAAFRVIGDNTLAWGLGLGVLIAGAVGFVFLRSQPPPDDVEAQNELVSADSGAD